MNRLSLLPAFALLLLAFAFPAQAHDYKLDQLTIEHPWARATIGQTKNGAAYLVVNNGGEDADKLIAVETAAAGRAELHSHTMEDGVMKMRKVEGIAVEPGSPAVLKPGGLHIMLFDLRAPLKEGERVPMTLVFETAGKVDVEVAVEGIAEMNGGHDGHEMNHDAGS